MNKQGQSRTKDIHCWTFILNSLQRLLNGYREIEIDPHVSEIEMEVWFFQTGITYVIDIVSVNLSKLEKGEIFEYELMTSTCDLVDLLIIDLIKASSIKSVETEYFKYLIRKQVEWTHKIQCWKDQITKPLLEEKSGNQSSDLVQQPPEPHLLQRSASMCAAEADSFDFPDFPLPIIRRVKSY